MPWHYLVWLAKAKPLIIQSVATTDNHFGRHVKRLRLTCGISQEELSFRAIISTSYVSKLERGLKSPTLGVIFKIAHALGVPGSELVRVVEESMAAGPRRG